ncbi:MFS transporter [Nocardioides sp.]|uniref:MFS transporter n=1 Tax=Nocardioides sp. TaxID=35761 RepID=UPI00260A7428|nr:MFS transporter [Nocardioides sp.]
MPGTTAQREKLVVPGLIILAMVTGVIGSLGAPIIPSIASTEHVGLRTAQWALTSGMLTSAVATPIVGRLGAGARRKPVIIGVLALVSFGGLLAALPLGIALLIAGRALQGIGLGLSPLVFAVARDALPPERRRGAIAAISVAGVIAAGLGFPVTAFTAEVAGVKGAFWLGLGLTLVALVVAIVTVPPSDEPAPSQVDWLGALLLGCGTFALLLAISQADHWGYLAAPTITVLAAAILLVVACIAWLRRAAFPLVDLTLATHPGVAAAHMAALLAGASMYLDFALVMVLVQTPEGHGYGLDHSVALAGSMMLPYAVAGVIGNRTALRLASVIGPDRLLPLGCALFGSANLLLWLAPASVPMVIVMMVLAGLGSGLTFNSIPWLMLRFVPAAETGSSMSLNMVMRFLGFSLGSALALAVQQGFADAAGHSTRLGYEVGGALGVGIAVVAVVCCTLLGKHAARHPVIVEESEPPLEVAVESGGMA